METLTFLFTDIEGSTAMLTRLGDAYGGLLAEHHEIIRGGLAANDGHEIDTTGDGFFAVFSSPRGSLVAAIEMQRSLAAHAWPNGEHVRVRMGIHTGEAAREAIGPVGIDVHRAARITAVGHGEQVLVSASTAAIAQGSLPEGARLRDLGRHRLKDLGEPEQLFQLEVSDLPNEFPPLRSLDNPNLPNNLPSFLSEFVGRADELTAVRDLVRSSRLVTLAGSGGCGKTRLALQVAADLLDGSSGGVWFVDLAPLSDEDEVPSAVVSTLGLQVASGRPLLESIVEILRDQTVLLVLDNCEHVIGACAKLADAVGRACPHVHLLATSLEPLDIDGEHVYRVPSLSLPKEQPDGSEDLSSSDAAQLFLMRAHERDPTFTLDAHSSPLVAQVCRRLDGIPLALELAAARLSSMSLGDLVGRLDQRFRLLTGGSRTALGRRQTLEATVTWSYELLNDAERDVLRRLSVFSGSFDLEAAEAICGTSALAAFEVDDLIGSLVSKSLVIAERTSGYMRYRLLESIRDYASLRFAETDGEAEVASARRAHAAFYLSLAERLAPSLIAPEQSEMLRRLDFEWDNLKATFAHFLAEPADHVSILRLGVALQRFVWNRDHVEVLEILQDASRDVDAPAELRARALHVVVFLMNTNWVDPSVPRHLSKEALELAKVGNSPELLALTASAFEAMSAVAPISRDGAGDGNPAEDAVALARRLSDPRILCLSLICRGIAQPHIGRECFEEALQVVRPTEDVFLICLAEADLAFAEFRDGKLDVARAHLEATISVAEDVGNVLLLVFLWSSLGVALVLLGEFAEAASAIRRCLIEGRRRGLNNSIGDLVAGLARCASENGEQTLATLLYGAADAMFAEQATKSRLDSVEQELVHRWSDGDRARLRDALGPDEYERLCREGNRLTLDQAIQLCLGLPTAPTLSS
jgi:predicted ATPase/class 3 adenylate cyclase